MRAALLIGPILTAAMIGTASMAPAQPVSPPAQVQAQPLMPDTRVLPKNPEDRAYVQPPAPSPFSVPTTASPQRPCECAIPQASCVATVSVTDVGRRKDDIGADIAYTLSIASTTPRCSHVGYTLHLSTPDGRSEQRRFEAIFAGGAYEAGAQIRANLSAESKLFPSGVTCFVCGD